MSSYFNGEQDACIGARDIPDVRAGHPRGFIDPPSSAGRRVFEPGAWAPDGGFVFVANPAQKRVVPFWSRFGFRLMAKNTSLVFSDHEYVEMLASLEPHEDSLTIHSDPYMLIRPEGRWDEVGVLERSAVREATNPR